jgi:hypothetical protein
MEAWTKKRWMINRFITNSFWNFFVFQNLLSGVLTTVSLVRGRAFYPVAVGFGIARGLTLGIAHSAAGRLGATTTTRRFRATRRLGAAGRSRLAARRLRLAARRLGLAARRLGLATRRFGLATRRFGLAARRARLATRGAGTRFALAARRGATTMPHGGNGRKTFAGFHVSQSAVTEVACNKLIPR